MEDMQMLEILQGIVQQYKGEENFIIASNMVLLTDLGLNSYELVELLCEVEEKFAVEISDRAMGNFKTVQDVINYISVYE